jgi:hypothetical protein
MMSHDAGPPLPPPPALPPPPPGPPAHATEEPGGGVVAASLRPGLTEPASDVGPPPEAPPDDEPTGGAEPPLGPVTGAVAGPPPAEAPPSVEEPASVTPPETVPPHATVAITNILRKPMRPCIAAKDSTRGRWREKLTVPSPFSCAADDRVPVPKPAASPIAVVTTNGPHRARFVADLTPRV